MKKRAFFTLLIIISGIALAVLIRAHNHDLLLQGEVDATEVIVSSKAKGRVVEKLVRRGDDVSAGQSLMVLEAPELIAQLKAAEAARDQAQATLDLSLNGTREETIRNLKALLQQAQATWRDAQSTWQRDLSVAQKGYISAEQLDNARQARDGAWQSRTCWRLKPRAMNWWCMPR